MLSLLDLSAAFDTVDHHTLLQRLRTSYGLNGVVIKWLTSYLTGRTQFVRKSSTTSPPPPVIRGVPQGLILGPILFLLYVADLLQLIKRHQLVLHGYVDDNQIYGFCRPCDVDVLSDKMSACSDEALSWIRANRLQANPSKTEVLWCSSGHRQHQIGSVRIGTADVLPVSSVRNPGMYIDSDVATHITATVRSCFSALQQLRSVRQCLPQQTLVMSDKMTPISHFCNLCKRK